MARIIFDPEKESVDEIYSKFSFAMDGLTREEKIKDLEECTQIEGRVFWGNCRTGFNRAKGPAVLKYLNENLVEAFWYKNNKLHNANGPAYIKYENGFITTMKYYCEGKLHSYNDIPSCVEYYQHGFVVKEETWHEYGIELRYETEDHRIPVRIRYHPNGNVSEEYYAMYGDTIERLFYANFTAQGTKISETYVVSRYSQRIIYF